MKMQTQATSLSTEGHISSRLARGIHRVLLHDPMYTRDSHWSFFSKALQGAIGQFTPKTPTHFFLEHIFSISIQSRTKKIYTLSKYTLHG